MRRGPSSLIGALLAGALLVTGCGATTDVVPPRQSAAPASVVATPATVRPPAIPRGAQRVEVAWVSDGDTVAVRALRRGVLAVGALESVRLLEIDTPESKDPDLPVECFALRATQATERLLPRGSVAWVVADRELRDRYDRALLYVWNADGVFVNLRLVRRGYARAVLFRPNDRYIDLMRSAEAAARRAGKGLWSAC
ncbi:thermonuclease family protein [Nocardioides cavernaquae]|nr:thermonuclease family protein [Nocardioides cavernaquae]